MTSPPMTGNIPLPTEAERHAAMERGEQTGSAATSSATLGPPVTDETTRARLPKVLASYIRAIERSYGTLIDSDFLPVLRRAVAALSGPPDDSPDADRGLLDRTYRLVSANSGLPIDLTGRAILNNFAQAEDRKHASPPSSPSSPAPDKDWQITTLRSALENWGRHFEWCDRDPCNCGYLAALKRPSFISKEWCIAAAEREGDSEVGVGPSSQND